MYNVYKLCVCTARRVDDQVKAALHGCGAAAIYYSYIEVPITDIYMYIMRWYTYIGGHFSNHFYYRYLIRHVYGISLQSCYKFNNNIL